MKKTRLLWILILLLNITKCLSYSEVDIDSFEYKNLSEVNFKLGAIRKKRKS